MLNIITALGLLIGSFLNVCIYRIPENKSISYPPSHCLKCKTRLRPMDLIPVFSYLFTKGKCRYCGEKISPQYPIVEMISGIIYLLLFLKFGQTIFFIKYAILASLLIVIAFIDLKHQIIPDGLIILGFIIGFIFNILITPRTSFIQGIMGLLIGGGLFLIIAVVTNGAMGGGDIKLMGVLGFALGWKYILLIAFLSFVIGALISIFLLIFKIKGRKDYIPFGPFISISAFITMLYGTKIISWYLVFFY